MGSCSAGCELIGLRRILSAVVGKSHLAYQALRVSRAPAVETEEEDSVVEDQASDNEAPVINGASNGANGSKPITVVVGA